MNIDEMLNKYARKIKPPKVLKDFERVDAANGMTEFVVNVKRLKLTLLDGTQRVFAEGDILHRAELDEDALIKNLSYNYIITKKKAETRDVQTRARKYLRDVIQPVSTRRMVSLAQQAQERKLGETIWAEWQAHLQRQEKYDVEVQSIDMEMAALIENAPSGQ